MADKAQNKDSLQRLIQLAKADGGKFFVIDESGAPQLVIMPIDEYEKVLLRKVQGQIEDIEDINRKIIEAQKIEEQALRGQRRTSQPSHDELVSEVIDSTFEFEPPMPQQPAVSPDPWEPGASAQLEDI